MDFLEADIIKAAVRFMFNDLDDMTFPVKNNGASSAPEIAKQRPSQA